MGKTKASDYFKNMDEVADYVESLKMPPKGKYYMRLLFGLLENEGDSIPVLIDGKKINIDISIADTVIAFNNAGLKVLACCSGLASEHTHAKTKHTSGYISILKTPSSETLFRKLFTYKDIKIEYDGETYLKPSLSLKIEGSEKVKAYKWKKILSDVKKAKHETGQS